MTKANDYERYAAERQQRLQKGQSLPHRFVEKPAMKSLLPDLSGKKVLLIGCGTGEESVLLSEFGAESIVGIDNSPTSIQLAKETYPEHTFEVVDMNNLPYEDASFDFVYSSLAVHYSATPGELYKEIARVLKQGGAFQFSTVHPLRWASERIEIDGVTSKVLGYSEDENHPRLYGSYMDFRSHSETFPNGEVLEFWVGPPSLHFRLLQQAGFQVESFIETQPIEECKAVDAYYYERNSHFPQFAVFSARKHEK